MIEQPISMIQFKRRKYIQSVKQKGYVRVNKLCPEKYRKSVNSIIDLLSCHFEDPESTIDFHKFISSIEENCIRLRIEYNIENKKISTY